jgi:hypothetical protein
MAVAFLLASAIGAASSVPAVPITLARTPQVSPLVIDVARKEVLAIFDHGRVAVAWTESAEAPVGPRVVVLFRNADSFPIETDSRSLGLALLSPDEEAPATRVLVVFSDRLERLVPCDCPVKKGRALGRAIAHEVGHSLKYEARHSEAGLMRAEIPGPRWSAPHRQDFYLAAADAEEIRTRLTK